MKPENKLATTEGGEGEIRSLSELKDDVAKEYGHVNFAAVKNKYRKETIHAGDLIAFVDKANRLFYKQQIEHSLEDHLNSMNRQVASHPEAETVEGRVYKNTMQFSTAKEIRGYIAGRNGYPSFESLLIRSTQEKRLQAIDDCMEEYASLRVAEALKK